MTLFWVPWYGPTLTLRPEIRVRLRVRMSAWGRKTVSARDMKLVSTPPFAAAAIALSLLPSLYDVSKWEKPVIFCCISGREGRRDSGPRLASSA